MNQEGVWPIWLVISGGALTVLQAPVINGLSFDLFPFQTTYASTAIF